MKKRKTKGSSMILVIAIFGILSTLGVAMLGTTYANYKLRIEENNRVKNLYSAESGIDKAYVQMSKIIDDGIKKGIEEVEKAILEASKLISDKPEDKVVTIERQNSIFKNKYTEYIVANLGGETRNKISGIYRAGESEAIVTCKLKNKGEEILNDDVVDKIAKLTSRYTDSNGKERVVSVAYTLIVPEDFRTVDKVDGKVSPIINYSIATDENLIIRNNDGVKTEMTINGDIWVQGTRSNNMAANPTTDKYKGGIEITNTDVNFVGQVNTASNISVDNISADKSVITFQDIDDRGKEIDTNVFAENIFLGNLINSDSSSRIEVKGNYTDKTKKTNVYLANDLVISSNDAKVNVDNLYGFNDITLKSDINNGKEVRESSSIIINSMSWPQNKAELKVNNSAYIMGTAYIKTKAEPYQTGESVALKGNYKAYSQPMVDKDGSVIKYQYEYLDPLMLVTKNQAGKGLTLQEKAEYFKAYSENLELRTGGISLPLETYTAGAYISNSQDLANPIKLPKATVETQTEAINKFKGEFVKSVYYMNSDDYKTENLNEDFLSGKPKNTVASEINWSGVDRLIAEKGNIIDIKDIKVILNNNADRIIDVSSNKISILEKDKTLITNGEISYDSNVNYVIVTKGIVNFNSSKTCNGIVVSLKDINIANQSGSIGLTRGLSEDDINKNKGILDLIFTKGENLVTERVITAKDIINKEKWTLEK
ncbi:MAG: hypothetical protein RSA29_01660 [Clostridium sp.]|uniref:hypothetical protein n=1 Tax=Clostridium sp. TaxID=1506 RepID=UPI003051EFAD